MKNFRATFGVICCIGLLIQAHVLAQSAQSNWSVHVWQLSDGLSSNNVTGVAQSKDGYIWVATDRRLSRFDGVRFTDYSPQAICGGTRTSIGAMIRSHDGGVVLAIHGGPVARLAIGAAPEIFSKDLSDASITSLREDGECAIWVNYRTGLVMRFKDGAAKTFTKADGLPAESTDCNFAEDSHGRLWFSQANAVGIYRDGRFVELARAPGATARIAAARKGGVWVCGGGQLLHCDDDGHLQEQCAFPPEFAPADINTLFEDRTGAIWIGTRYNGLLHFDGERIEGVPASHERINSIEEDTEGNIWVATAGGGLNRIRPRAVSLEGAVTGLAADSMLSICQDSNGTVWAAARDGVLKYRNGTQWITRSTEPDWPGGSALSVAGGPDGSLWIGTRYNRLLRLKDGKFTDWRQSDGVVSRAISILHVARNGDVWLIEQNNDLIQRLRNDKFTTFQVPPNLGHLRGIVEDKNGDIWTGADNGLLFRIHNDTLIDESARIKPAVKAVRALWITPDNSLWIAAGSAGLARLRLDGEKRFSLLKIDHGLYDNTISQIVADDHGWLWLGSSRGIFKVRQQQLNDVADGHGSRVQSVHYGEDEELPSIEATFASGARPLRTRDGKIWMLMGTALAIISPANPREQMQPPPVYLEKVTADDKTLAAYASVVPVHDAIDLRLAKRTNDIDPSHHRLQFDFTALSFDAPTNVRFQYRLVGLDDRWTDAVTRSATYPQLPAGNYSFEVRACNSDGVWNYTGASLAFAVVPFFYQTLLFKLLMLLAFTLLVVVAARYVSFRRLRNRLRVLEQQSALYNERTRIARDLHDDLGHGLTQIVLLSDLNAHDQVPADELDGQLRQIAATAKQGVKSLDETVWAINPRNDTLPDLIDYVGNFVVQSLRAAGLKCELDLPEQPPTLEVPSEVRHALFLVVKEAMNNVIRHAQARSVRLSITVANNAVALVIADDGRGGCPTNGNGHAGQDGLRNMHQRMQDIGGEFSLDSAPGRGTRISLTYRLSQAKSSNGVHHTVTK